MKKTSGAPTSTTALMFMVGVVMTLASSAVYVTSLQGSLMGGMTNPLIMSSLGNAEAGWVCNIALGGCVQSQSGIADKNYCDVLCAKKKAEWMTTASNASSFAPSPIPTTDPGAMSAGAASAGADITMPASVGSVMSSQMAECQKQGKELYQGVCIPNAADRAIIEAKNTLCAQTGGTPTCIAGGSVATPTGLQCPDVRAAGCSCGIGFDFTPPGSQGTQGCYCQKGYIVSEISPGVRQCLSPQADCQRRGGMWKEVFNPNVGAGQTGAGYVQGECRMPTGIGF